HLVVNVETTPAPVSDNAMTIPIHQALADRELSPSVHLLDAGYVDAAIVINGLSEHDINVVGPVLAGTSWQAKTGEGFDISAFGLRQCRYIGLAKTRFQHVITALAMNVVRIDAWLTGRPFAKTRRSAFAAMHG